MPGTENKDLLAATFLHTLPTMTGMLLSCIFLSLCPSFLFPGMFDPQLQTNWSLLHYHVHPRGVGLWTRTNSSYNYILHIELLHID